MFAIQFCFGAHEISCSLSPTFFLFRRQSIARTPLYPPASQSIDGSNASINSPTTKVYFPFVIKLRLTANEEELEKPAPWLFSRNLQIAAADWALKDFSERTWGPFLSSAAWGDSSSCRMLRKYVTWAGWQRTLGRHLVSAVGRKSSFQKNAGIFEDFFSLHCHCGMTTGGFSVDGRVFCWIFEASKNLEKIGLSCAARQFLGFWKVSMKSLLWIVPFSNSFQNC